MGTTKFLITDIEWGEDDEGPSAVVVALPDWLVLSDMPRGAKALAAWEADWKNVIREEMYELLNLMPITFRFEPAKHDDPIGPYVEEAE